MRITAGYARGILLNSPRGDATRPATDAARLAIFSSLGEVVENANVLDIFAGTGSYGLEAASRGAKKIVFIENNANAYKALKTNISLVRKSVDAEFSAIFADCFRCAKPLSDEKFDLIFADPPYALLSNKDFCKKLFELFATVAKENSLIILEAPAEFEVSEIENAKIEIIKRLGKKSKGKPTQIIFSITPNPTEE